MKIRKASTILVIVLVFICVFLSGCVNAEVRFRKDGSGSAVINVKKIGLETKEQISQKIDKILQGVTMQSEESGKVTVKGITESEEGFRITLNFKRITDISGLGYFRFLSADNFGAQRTERMVFSNFEKGKFSLKGSNFDNSTYSIYEDSNNALHPLNVKTGEFIETKNFSEADSDFYSKDNTVFIFMICGIENLTSVEFSVPGKIIVSSDKNLQLSGESSVKATSSDVKADLIGIREDGITSYKEENIDAKAFVGYIIFQNSNDYTSIIVVSAIALILAGAVIVGYKTGFFKRFFASKTYKLIVKHRMLYLFILPGFALMLVFNYAPMAGIIVAFKNYTVDGGMFGSEWVGFNHFVTLFTHPGTEFWMIFRNTIVMAMLKFLFGFPSSIILALMFNAIHKKAFKRTVQTISYLPYFVSWVVVSNITYILLSANGGIANSIFAAFNIPQVKFYSEPKYWWGILTVTSIWKNLGWGTIIYLAAITNINPEHYEAASIDGASGWHKLWNVTLPGMMPVIGIQLILSAGGLIKDDFDQIFTMVGSSNYTLRSVTEVFSSLVYRQLQGGVKGFSSATAVSFVQSIISLGLVLFSNKMVKKSENQGLW